MWYLPKQKLSESERTDKWKEDTMKHFTSYSSFYSQEKWDLITLYKAAEGVLNANEYKYVLNPYNSKEENIRKFPAQMRNIDIISPILKLVLGEKAEKPDIKTVVCLNEDSPKKFTDSLNAEFEGLMYQDFINNLNAQGVNTGVESKEIPSYEQFIADKKSTWLDKRAEMGQEALDYLRYNLDLKDRYQIAFRDWTITNRVYTYKYILNNDVKFEVVPTLELWHGTTNTGFVEDAAWAVRKFRLSASEILDRLNKFLTDDDVAWVESKMRYDNTATTSTINQTTNIDTRGDSRESQAYLETGLIYVFHVTWKTFQKYGALTYLDEFGVQQMMFVDETYKLNTEAGDIEIEWLWGNLVMEGYQIEDRVLVKTVKPIEPQRNEMDNISVCKLPYNGRVDRTPSMVQILLNYQALINIYHYRAELTLARNKDKIMLMPKGLLPAGWEPDKAMYFAEATGIMWFDETKPNAGAVMSAIRGIDMGLGNYVAEMRNLLKDIKDEAWDAVGMNRQRYGDTNSSDGKGVNQDAVLRSATITKEHFRKFEKLEEKDAQGLLDYSKAAWKNGKKGSYIRSDGSVALLNIDGADFQEAELGVFAKDSLEEFRKLETGKQLASTFAQKGVVKPSTVFEIIDSNNLSKVKAYMKKAEAIEEKMKQASEQAALESNERIAQMNNETAKIDSETKLQVANINANAVIQAAQIKAHTDITTTDMDNQANESETELPDNSQVVKDIRNKFDADQKNGLAANKNANDVRMKERELALKKEEMESKERIAKTNKNKHDK